MSLDIAPTDCGAYTHVMQMHGGSPLADIFVADTTSATKVLAVFANDNSQVGTYDVDLIISLTDYPTAAPVTITF